MLLRWSDRTQLKLQDPILELLSRIKWKTHEGWYQNIMQHWEVLFWNGKVVQRIKALWIRRLLLQTSLAPGFCLEAADEFCAETRILTRNL